MNLTLTNSREENMLIRKNIRLSQFSSIQSEENHTFRRDETDTDGIAHTPGDTVRLSLISIVVEFISTILKYRYYII
jgi:hypothetical protein